MPLAIGEQYTTDDSFKEKARLHQSKYRANVLRVGYNRYGNRLEEADGKQFLNYYDDLNCRAALRDRYPRYSKGRDADMLRSEHIPFNLFPPLELDKELAKKTIWRAFGVECAEVLSVNCEWAPKPRGNYLDDMTSFDAYISYRNSAGKPGGIGIEVKYTEREYRIGESEKKRVEDKNSTYWTTTKASGTFIGNGNDILGTDPLRQVWRNHLLGLKMIQRGEIDEFYSITLHPEGNRHFQMVIPQYRALIREEDRRYVFGCTYEKFFESISGDEIIQKWKAYLVDRYIVD